MNFFAESLLLSCIVVTLLFSRHVEKDSTACKYSTPIYVVLILLFVVRRFTCLSRPSSLFVIARRGLGLIAAALPMTCSRGTLAVLARPCHACPFRCRCRRTAFFSSAADCLAIVTRVDSARRVLKTLESELNDTMALDDEPPIFRTCRNILTIAPRKWGVTDPH